MTIRFHLHGRGSFDAGHPIGPCAWPHFDLLAVHSGRVWIELMHADRIELAQRQAILIYPHTHFAGASLTKRSRVSVQHFGITEAERRHDAAHPVHRLIGRERGHELYSQKQSDLLEADILRAVDMAHAPVGERSHGVREAMLALVLGQLVMHVRGDALRDDANERIDLLSLTQWMAANLQRQFSLDDMAAAVGYSTSHFRALFKQQVGHAPGLFLRQRRHIEAGRLLRETRATIKEVAVRVGYADLAHFYRFFTTMARLTPKQYRLRHQLRG